MTLSQLYPNDNLSVEKIKKLIYGTIDDEDMWSDLLPSYQMICVKWLVDELEKTQDTLKQLVGVIDAHEIESLDCDNRGDYYCDCLTKEVKKIKESLI